MRQHYNNILMDSMCIPLWQEDHLPKLREAGKCFSAQMHIIKNLIENKTTMTLLEISRMIGQNIKDAGFIPTFKHYKVGRNTFPEDLCISVNRELVHGIGKNSCLEDGDIVSFDFGVTNGDAIVDAARTFIFGTPKTHNHIKLIQATRLCLDNAINNIKLGKRVGEIGHSIYKTALSKGFKTIEVYGGHGIAPNKVHSSPFIANRANKEDGPHFMPGMLLAIEPLLVPYNSSIKTSVKNDNWSVITDEIGAHFEDTVYINKDGNIEVLTKDL